MCWPPGKAERKYAGITHIDVTGFNQSRADEILSLSNEYMVDISALGYYPNPLDPDKKSAKTATDHLEKLIKASSLLGVNKVNTFVGRNWKWSVDENWPLFLETWKPLIALAEKNKVQIGIENCPMFFTDDEWPGGKNLAYCPAIWRRMFKDISSRYFGLNYDPSHLVWMQMDWLKPLKEFSSKLYHVHAKDVRLNKQGLDDEGILATPLKYHQPRIPGFGEIDWGRFIGTLKEVGYDGPVCIEVEDDTFGKTLEGRKNALRVARNVLLNYFP